MKSEYVYPDWVNYDVNSLYAELKSHMRYKNISQVELAKEIKSPPSFVCSRLKSYNDSSSIKNIQNMNVSKFLQICTAIDFPYDKLNKYPKRESKRESLNLEDQKDTYKEKLNLLNVLESVFSKLTDKQRESVINHINSYF